jgi:hypothetical protein
VWPDYHKLPVTQKVKFVQHPVSKLREKFPRDMLTDREGIRTDLSSNDSKQFIYS